MATRWQKKLTQISRRRAVVQGIFLGFILFVSIRHNLLETVKTPSHEAYCPMGGLVTLWEYVRTGQTLKHIHPSNLVMALALLIAMAFGGNAFCGWVCPFGAIHDALTWVRRRLRLPEITVPARLDRWLRYGRFVVLALILFMTIRTTTLWFADYDPYRTLIGLEWIFEFSPESWAAYLITIVTVAVALLVPRFWCRYACPLGGAINLLGHISILRIRRSEEHCTHCGLCNTKKSGCPVGIDVEHTAHPLVNTDCVGCLNCVSICPSKGALEVALAPAWIPRPRGPRMQEDS